MLPLGVRNRLAELVVAAFDAPDARATLAAATALDQAPQGLGPEEVARLEALGWLERGPGGEPRLPGALRPFRVALAARARAALVAVAGAPTAGAGRREVVLERAARLADQGLYFEVHELLEPVWFRAAGSERVALQGLIQVAVALHHLAHGHREGALSLLAEGLGRLAAARGVLPMDTAAWEQGLAALRHAVAAGAPAPPAPPWPRPTPATQEARPWPSS